MHQLSIRNITDQELSNYFREPETMRVQNDPIAHEQSVLSVGGFYTVAHCLVEFADGVTELVPISPLLHADKAFSPAPAHYHIDGRFQHTKRFKVRDGKTQNAVFTPGTANLINNGGLHHYNAFNGIIYTIKELVWIRKVCVRLTTGLQFITFDGDLAKPLDFIAWEQSMVGKSCAGKRCPHYGTVMIDTGDKLVCPMHGLIGSKETETIIPDDTI